MSLLFPLLVTLCITPRAQAYVNTLNSKGALVHWKQPVKIKLIGNLQNKSGLSPNQVWDAAVISLQRWKAAATGAVDFDYWQGHDQSVYPSNNEFNKVSSLYFISNSSPPTEISANVLGLTEVWYKAETGEILETDIALNDRDFIFTNNPHDTSGYGGDKVHLSDGKSSVYLQNVIAHEIGHALGLSHSAMLQSTMLFMESPEQAHLACDEQIGIHALYPSSDQALRGTIQGTVLTAAGHPVLGAHIQAISQQRGTVLAAALSDRSGKYQIDALEPGIYYLMIEPYFAGIQALPGYYSAMIQAPCNAGLGFNRSFSVNPGDTLQLRPVSVLENQVTRPPDLVIHCNESQSREGVHNLVLPQSVFLHADSYFGITDRLEQNSSKSYLLPQVEGRLEIHALAYSLYSPLHLSMSLISPDLSVINSQILDPVYVGESGYRNYDSVLIADNLPKGTYTLLVSGEALSTNNYPAGPISLDSIPFFLITGSLNNNPLPLEAVLPNNARCNLNEQFPPYASPSSLPPALSSSSSRGVGFCSSMNQIQKNNQRQENQHAPGEKPKASSDLASIVGWFFPWIILILWHSVFSRKNTENKSLNFRPYFLAKNPSRD